MLFDPQIFSTLLRRRWKIEDAAAAAAVAIPEFPELLLLLLLLLMVVVRLLGHACVRGKMTMNGCSAVVRA